MANIIKIKQSSVAAKVPLSSDLQQGELAINTIDEKLYTKNSSGNVVELGAGASYLNKVDATTAPTADDDSGDGYEVGSVWIDVTNNVAYTCVDATATSAVWSAGGGPRFTESTTEPTSPNAGDTWFDESEGKIFMRVDLSALTGLWIMIGTTDINAYDGGDSDQTAYTASVTGGNASTSTYTETVTGGSA
tara:strand:- start:911 stop:1483 length:573 start_codon:yes stop_codon:yes gene_type:complete